MPDGGEQVLGVAVVKAGADNSREHRRNAAVLDRIVSAVALEADVTGVDRSARRKDAHLGRLATGARDGFSVGAHHRRPDRERAEITIGGAARAKLVTEREPDVPARAHENFGAAENACRKENLRGTRRFLLAVEIRSPSVEIGDLVPVGNALDRADLGLGRQRHPLILREHELEQCLVERVTCLRQAAEHAAPLPLAKGMQTIRLGVAAVDVFGHR